MHDTQKVDLYATTNDSNITSLIEQQKVLRIYLWASTNYEHSTWLQPIMDTTYPMGPNQLWARKENSEPQPIMSTQKENTKSQPIMGTQDFGSQPIMGTMRP
jgi:hypothetical protein